MTTETMPILVVFFTVSLFVFVLSGGHKILKEKIQNLLILILKFRRLFQKSLRKNPNGTALSKEQNQALLLSAIIGEQNCAYWDTLATGMPRLLNGHFLRELWDINSAVDARTSIQERLDLDNEKEVLAWIRLFVTYEPAQWKKAIQSELFVSDENEIEHILACLKNLYEVDQVLKKEQVIKSSNELMLGVSAWNLARAVFLSRCCFDYGYITEKEAWDFIWQARQCALEKFKNWQEFSISYLLGRGIHFGTNSSISFDGIISISQKLLKEDKSPLCLYPFN